MFLKHLTVSGFRNILQAELKFSSRIAVFVGGNGQGKTSLLEAIYLLSHTKSFRTSHFKELVTRLPDAHLPTEVSAELNTSFGSQTLRYQYQKGKREVYVNANRVTAASDFYGVAKVIDFTPDDLFIVKGSPQERRRYLDKLLAIVDREYLENLVRYQRALKNRNALLTQQKGTVEGGAGKLRAELALWELPLIESGEIISKKRALLLAQLTKQAQVIYSSLSSSREQIRFIYKTNFKDTLDKKEEFQRRFERDLRTRSTSLGIHRDDIDIEIDTGFGMSDAKEIASQGQTRSLALALKLAGIEFLRQASAGEDPIVLLDDVESELDSSRKRYLLDYLLRIQSQVFVATTSEDALPGLAERAQYFAVRDGKITPF